MISENFNKLIVKLVAKTESNQAIWNKTKEDGEFRLLLKTGIVTTKLWSSNSIGNINIFSVKGILMDTNTTHINEKDFTNLKNLHLLIESSFNKSDETFDKIFEELDNEDQIDEIFTAAPKDNGLLEFSKSKSNSKGKKEKVGDDSDLPF